MFDADKIESSLHDKKQASNIREQALREERGNKPRQNLADQLKEVLQNHFDKDSFVKILIFTEKDQLPIILLYDEDMLHDIRAFCGSDSPDPSVLGFDKTFNLSSCLVTIMVYKNKNLIIPGNTKLTIQLKD
jgi:hypothetical protein